MVSTFLFLVVFGVTVIFSFSGSAADNRPLVTLITVLQGPTSEEQFQWDSKRNNVITAIPDNDPKGASSDIVTTNISNGRCENIFDLRFMVDVNPERAADLIMTLSTVSQDGNTILKTREVFNGPSKAAGLSATAANDITFASDDYFDRNLGLPVTNTLLNPKADDGSPNNCGRWRLTVSDVVKGNVSTMSWTLSRRVAYYPYAHAVGRDAPSALRQYYAALLFGGGAASTPFNLADYFREVSRGNFSLYNAGIYGPVVWSNRLNNIFSCEGRNEVKPDVCPDSLHVDNVVHMLEEAGFDFRQFDKNRDGVISNDELAILAIDNYGTSAGAKRGNDHGCVGLKTPPLFKVCAEMVFVQQQIGFPTLIHEFSHLSIGAVDLYDENPHTCPSIGLTPMSCTIAEADEMKSVYLDPWHRIKAGWMSPYGATFGPYELGDETWTDFWGVKSRPVIFRKSDDLHEYFLFEYRDRRGYDQNVAARGLIAWHVKEKPDGNAFQGKHDELMPGRAIYTVGPINEIGGTLAWSQSDGYFQLAWADGSLLPYSFWVEEPRRSPNSIILNWRAAPPGNRPPDVNIVTPLDKSHGPIGGSLFQANVSDPEDGKNGLRIDWSSDKDGPLGTGSLIYYSFSTPNLPDPTKLTPTFRTVTVTARDQFGAATKKSVEYTVDDTPPTAKISFPEQGKDVYRKVPLVLVGTSTTPVMFELPCSRHTWTLDVKPGWAMSAKDSDSGCSVTEAFDVFGPATFTLTVKGDYQTSGTATVSVNFIDPAPNAPPFVSISSPTRGGMQSGMKEHFQGTVTDPGGGAVTYRWTVFDPRTSAETEIAKVPDFFWAPDARFEGRAIEIRLYGTNYRGAVGMHTYGAFVQSIPK